MSRRRGLYAGLAAFLVLVSCQTYEGKLRRAARAIGAVDIDPRLSLSQLRGLLKLEPSIEPNDRIANQVDATFGAGLVVLSFLGPVQEDSVPIDVTVRPPFAGTILGIPCPASEENAQHRLEALVEQWNRQFCDDWERDVWQRGAPCQPPWSVRTHGKPPWSVRTHGKPSAGEWHFSLEGGAAEYDVSSNDDIGFCSWRDAHYETRPL